MWIEGLRSYLLDWWNFLDVVILSLYLASFALRLLLAGLAYMHCQDTADSTTCRYFTTAGEEPCIGYLSLFCDEVPSKAETRYILVRKAWWVQRRGVTLCPVRERRCESCFPFSPGMQSHSG